MDRMLGCCSEGFWRHLQSESCLYVSALMYSSLNLPPFQHAKFLLFFQRPSSQPVAPELLVDGRYQHWEFVSVHLQFLAFLAQDGGIYLPLKRAAEVWDVLIQNPSACADDRTVSGSGVMLSLCAIHHLTILIPLRHHSCPITLPNSSPQPSSC